MKVSAQGWGKSNNGSPWAAWAGTKLKQDTAWSHSHQIPCTLTECTPGPHENGSDALLKSVCPTRVQMSTVGPGRVGCPLAAWLGRVLVIFRNEPVGRGQGTLSASH